MNRTLVILLVASVLFFTCVCAPIAVLGGLAVSGNVPESLSGITARNATSTPTRVPTVSRTGTPGPTVSRPGTPEPTAAPARTPAPPAASPTRAPSVADPLNATVIGDSFLMSLRDYEDEDAFALFHPGLQDNYADAFEFGELVTSNEVRPDTWEEWDISASSDDGEPTTVIMADLMFQDGEPGTVELEVIQFQGAPRIIRFNLSH